MLCLEDPSLLPPIFSRLFWPQFRRHFLGKALPDSLGGYGPLLWLSAPLDLLSGAPAPRVTALPNLPPALASELGGGGGAGGGGELCLS